MRESWIGETQGERSAIRTLASAHALLCFAAAWGTPAALGPEGASVAARSCASSARPRKYCASEAIAVNEISSPPDTSTTNRPSAMIAGGRGTVVGTLLGVLLFALVGSLLVLNGVSPYWHQVLTGGVVLTSLALQPRARPSFFDRSCGRMALTIRRMSGRLLSCLA